MRRFPPISTSRIGRNVICLLVGGSLLYFVLSPFPGMAMIYPITDSLRGHPEKPHGSHPADFVGLWVRDETVRFDYVGQAFYLMPDGRCAGTSGMTVRRWHFDDDSLYVDSVSLCGNCYRGNQTTTLATTFVDPDHLLITNRNGTKKRGIGGNYRRVKISSALKSKMMNGDGIRARSVSSAIAHFEHLSGVQN